MKYIEVKKLLESVGFKLEGYQTSYELDKLSFYHPKIKGEIFVDFEHDIDYPQDILDGREFSYDNENEEWLMNLDINSIEFDIDVSISYMSEDVLDTCGAKETNTIYLTKEDIYLTPKIISIITNPYGFIEFQKEHSEKLSEFFEWAKTYFPSVEKYNLIPSSFPTSGNETTLYRNIALRLSTSDRCFIDFYFDILTWKKNIVVKIEPGFIPDSGYLKDDCSIEEFVNEVERQMVVKMEFDEKLKMKPSVFN